MKKYVLGIFGKTGSGKSTIAKILSERYNFYHIDVDKIGHKILEEKKDEIIKLFGKDVIADGNIDRKKLGDIVFKDRVELNKLNFLVHPEIKRATFEEIKKANAKYIVIDAALLFEIGLDEYCNFLVMVDCEDSLIIERNKVDRNWDEVKTKNILKSQEYIDILRGRADFIIFNNGDELKLNKQIEFLIHIIF